MSHVEMLTHIVIATYCRRMTIPEEHKRELYAYMYGILNNYHCKVYRINGIGNHVHILANLHSMTALGVLVKELKRCSSLWMHANPEKFPKFESWGEDYGAFSRNMDAKNTLIEYVRNQEKHHQLVSFDDEWREMTKMSEGNPIIPGGREKESRD